MLPYESLEKFIGISTTITIKRNDHFVKEDDICRYIGIVKSGTLYSYFEDSDANMLVNELYSKQFCYHVL